MNHIFIDSPYADAWQCWSCFTNHWIDTLSKTTYMLERGLNDTEADRRLIDGHITLYYLNGQANV